jgi:hypothetical protein
LPEARRSGNRRSHLQIDRRNDHISPFAGGRLASRPVRRRQDPRSAVDRHADWPILTAPPHARATRLIEKHFVVIQAQRRRRRHQRPAAQHVERVHMLYEFGDISVDDRASRGADGLRLGRREDLPGSGFERYMLVPADHCKV